MSSSVVRSCLLASAAAVEKERDALGRLDAVAGDGDHGVTMALAGRAVARGLEAARGLSAAEAVRRSAGAMSSVGGAIGPIYGAAMTAVAATMDSFGNSEPSVGQLHACAAAALAAVKKLGDAEVGDKTIIDALEPVVRALADAEARGLSVNESLQSAATAARAGAESTVDMVARVGRASRLGERSRGYADPGATSFAAVIDAAVQEFIDGQSRAEIK